MGMGKWHYYNEFDPFAAEWLRNLIKKGLIPDGEVDTRSIVDVGPDDVRGVVQCHFFAGIGGWPLALRFAGWPEDRPVWTGSCPCQPFSVAGKGKGTDDERHLWPAFFNLIRECRPATVFGEQVASKAGRGWLSGVFADLEGVGYAGAGADLCAPGLAAPHIRQRLYWVATDVGDTNGRRRERYILHNPSQRGENSRNELGNGGSIRDMADAEGFGRRGRADDENEGRREQPFADTCARSGDVADADDAGREGRTVHAERADERSPWSHGVEWRRGADGKERRVKRGVRLLAPGLPECLDVMRDIERKAWEVLSENCEGNADEGLRILRDAIRAQARRKKEISGVLLKLHAEEILLDFLLCVEATCGGTVNRKLVPEACAEARKRIVQRMWAYEGTCRSSCGWQPDEQFSEQSTDALLPLSFLLARLASAYWEATRDAYAASNRVGALRGFGNAIVPQLAAEFIKVFMSYGE